MDLLQYIREKKHRLIYPQMGAWGLSYTNYKLYEVYKDTAKQLELAQLLEKYIPIDFSYPLDYGALFTEALGVCLLRPDYDFPSTKEILVKNMDDLAALPQIKPDRDGLMPQYLETIRFIARNIDKPEMISLMGPFTLAAELAGVENLCRATVKSPDFVDAIVEYCTEAILVFIQAAIDNGAQVIQISEPTGGILSPASFRRYIGPKLTNIHDSIHRAGAASVLHICGKTYKLLAEMLSCGAQALSLDQIMDLGNVAKIIPEDIIIIGNIDPVGVLYEGSPDLVKMTTKKLLSDMKDYPNFIAAPGCDLVIGSPIENIEAFIDTIYEDTIF